MERHKALKNKRSHVVSTGLLLAKTSEKGATKTTLQQLFIKSMIQSCGLQSTLFPITLKIKYPRAHLLFSTEDV